MLHVCGNARLGYKAAVVETFGLALHAIAESWNRRMDERSLLVCHRSPTLISSMLFLLSIRNKDCSRYSRLSLYDADINVSRLVFHIPDSYSLFFNKPLLITPR
jgi:hypothetical protein